MYGDRRDNCCLYTYRHLFLDSQLGLQLVSISVHARGEVFVPLVHSCTPLSDACCMEVSLGHKSISEL